MVWAVGGTQTIQDHVGRAQPGGEVVAVGVAVGVGVALVPPPVPPPAASRASRALYSLTAVFNSAVAAPIAVKSPVL